MELSLARLSAGSVATTSSADAPTHAARRATPPSKRPSWWIVAATAATFALGLFLRLYPTSTYPTLGYDEHDYMVFLREIKHAGLANYDAVVHVYLERQYAKPNAEVPATRIGFLAPAYLTGEIFHLRPFKALQLTAGVCSSLLLLVAAMFAWRIGGAIPMLAVSVLVATSPLQLQLAQHTMIDACFSFWAVAVFWLLWENLQHPRDWRWLAAYAGALLMLVLTKESAAFVVAAILALFVFNQLFRVGTVTLPLLGATVLMPAIAIIIIAMLMGGFGEFVRFFQMFTAKQRTSFYSVMAQDGAWYRYIVDFLLLSPMMIPFAFGRMLNLKSTDRAEIAMTVFLAASFVVMANVQYGVSVRYAAYWEVPLAYLACSQMLNLSRRFARVRPVIIAVGLFLVTAACGLRQYDRYFIEAGLYDPITRWLAHASDLVK